MLTDRLAAMLFLCAGATVLGAVRQQPAPPGVPPLPVVISAPVPIFPPIAAQARLQGDVELHVATDGQRVASVQVVQKNPLFEGAAVAGVRAWQFAPHTSTSFNMVVHFRLREPPARMGCWSADEPVVTTFTLPTDLEVSGYPIGICEPGPFESMPKGFVVSTVSGTLVCDCLERVPIAGASVHLESATGSTAFEMMHSFPTTDAQGRFQIQAVPGGTYSLFVDAPGYYARRFRIRVIPETHDTGRIDVALKPDLPLQQFMRDHPHQSAWVSSSAIPTYPLEAVAVGVQGVVRLRVAADGQVPSVVEGDPTLAKAAMAYAATWNTATHGQAFEVRLTYKLLPGDCTGGGPYVVVKFPYEVEIAAKRPIACGR